MGVYAEGDFEAFYCCSKICVLILLTSFWQTLTFSLSYSTLGMDIISIPDPARLDCGPNILFIPALH